MIVKFEIKKKTHAVCNRTNMILNNDPSEEDREEVEFFSGAGVIVGV